MWASGYIPEVKRTETADGLEVGRDSRADLVWGHTGISGQAVEKVNSFGILNMYYVVLFMHLYYELYTFILQN